MVAFFGSPDVYHRRKSNQLSTIWLTGHFIHSLLRIRENGLMRIRRNLFLIPGLTLVLAQPSWASGPFRPSCATEQSAAEDTLKDLRMCLEKAGVRKRDKKTSDS